MNGHVFAERWDRRHRKVTRKPPLEISRPKPSPHPDSRADVARKISGRDGRRPPSGAASAGSAKVSVGEAAALETIFGGKN